MSSWIKVTNLPYYYDEKEAVDMFEDIGPIKRVYIEHVPLLLKSTAFIQFVNPRHARSAATKKDQIVFVEAVIRVRVIWSCDESLSTVKVSNLPPDITAHALREYFAPYGDIVDITFNKTPESEHDPVSSNDKSTSADKEVVAWISFARVDYALRACQEMHHSIISGAFDDSGLCVKLVNPDSRNLKWKRNLFEYVRSSIPDEHTKNVVRISKNVNENSTRRIRSKSVEPKSSLSGDSVKSVDSDISPASSSQTLNVSPSSLLNRHTNGTGSAMNWRSLSMYAGNPGAVGGNAGAWNTPSLVSGLNVAAHSNIGSVPYSANLNNVNTFNNGVPNLGDGLSGMVPLSSSAFGPLMVPTINNTNTFLSIPQNGVLIPSISSPSSNSSLVSPGASQFFSISNSPSMTSFLPSLPQANVSMKIDNNNNSGYISNVGSFYEHPKSVAKDSSRIAANERSSSSSSSIAPSTIWGSKSDTKLPVRNLSDLVSHSKKVSPSKSVASVKSDTSTSSSVWSSKQREMGDTIYRELKSEFPSRVAKLTGMLLSLPEQELDRLVNDRQKLKARAHQFCQLLDTSGSN